MDGPYKGSPESAALDEPPLPQADATSRLALGAGLMALAAVAVQLPALAGLSSIAEALNRVSGLAVLLVAVGAILVGSALAARPLDQKLWLLALVAALLGRWGIPESFDSLRILMNVATLGAALGLALSSMPRKAALTVGGLLPFLHFLGIFAAVTSPSPQPWLGQQLWNRVYRPYLQLAYLNNAYQFYSPDPGPACQLWFCVTYGPEGTEAPSEVVSAFPDNFDQNDPKPAPAPQGKIETAWHKLPLRPAQYLDPLGQTYYRRLSIAEQTMAQPPPGYLANFRDAEDAQRARQAQAIPFHPDWPLADQYRLPNDQVSRFVMPSYVRHVAHEMARPGKTITGIKVYRVVHRIIQAATMAGVNSPDPEYGIVPMDPYDPVTYLPYYQGDFRPDGTLKNPNDPMLYWMVPILYRSADPALRPKPHSVRSLPTKKYDELYFDHVKAHSGSDHTAKEGAK